jgi:two-component system, cell cycle response regulator
VTALRSDVGSAQDLSAYQMPELADSDGTGLATAHESIAAVLASSGQWRQAYEHLRTALDLHRAECHHLVRVPEQLRREVDRLRQAHAEAREQSLRDSLTSSYNRRYLDQRLVGLLTDRAGDPAGLAVALMDLDWFKRVNDNFGHLLGDRVLQRVVELLCTDLPDGAFCARYGGEEFAIVMPGLDAETAIAVCEAARARIEHYPWHELAAGLRVTVSGGVAHDGPQTADGADGHQLRCADILLYAAKRSGRNAVAYRGDGRVRLAGPAAQRRCIAQPEPPVASRPHPHPLAAAGDRLPTPSRDHHLLKRDRLGV